MSLRSWFLAVSLSLIVASLLAASALLVFGRRLASANQGTVRDLAVVESTNALELSLNRHRRQVLAWALTKRPERREGIDRERTAIAHSIAAARARMPEQFRTAFSQAAGAVHRYLEQPEDSPVAASVSLIAALEDIELLATAADDAAHASQESALEVERRLIALGLSLGLCVVTIAGLVVISLRSRLLVPVRALLDAIGLMDARAGYVAQGLSGEFGAIDLALSRMAATIARQREAQLRFVASVAHDLRNPLTTLKVYASMFQKGRPLPPEEFIRRAAGMIEREVQRLNRQIEDLLDRSRVEAGAFELHRVQTDVAPLVHEAAEHFEALAPKRLTVATDREVPAFADPDKLYQSIANLLSNAIKYSPGGGSIALSARAEPGHAVIEVRDQGIGISASDQQSIFEPFRRSDSVRELDIPGVGLGLSATRRIVEGHGGRIELESEPGHGSTFRIRLPSAPPDPSSRLSIERPATTLEVLDGDGVPR